METKKAPQIPYGISDFVRMRTENYYYVDKTMYLPMIEDFPHPWRHAHLSDICSTHESDPHPAMAKRRKIHIFFRPIPTGIKQHIGYIVFCGKINTSHTASRCQCNFTNYLSGLDPASVRNLIRFVQIKYEVIILDQFSRKG